LSVNSDSSRDGGRTILPKVFGVFSYFWSQTVLESVSINYCHI